VNTLLHRLLPKNVPEEYRGNFIHLILDIGWYAVLAGSAINFQSVYAARIGATSLQIGLLSAIPALISLGLSIPAGSWLEKRPIGSAVFWTSVIYRLGFLSWVFLPLLPTEENQIATLTFIILLQAIPLTALAVGFSALFAAAVPPDWRASIAGLRNVVLSIAFMATSLISGWLLDRLPFPLNYQIIFGIGFLGAAMSSLHLYFVRPLSQHTPPQPPTTPPTQSPLKNFRAALRLDVWRGGFRSTLLVMLFFHFGQHLAIPLFPVYFVRTLHLTDEHIGIGTALFYLTTLIGSTQLARLTHKMGNHRTVTGVGVLGMSLYPLMLAFSSEVWHFYVISILGGVVWALVGGAYANYIIEKVPENDRPAHLAWYNVVLNASVLTGSLLGPALADWIGLSIALAVAGVLRLLAGILILRRG
jgi:MFS family permease